MYDGREPCTGDKNKRVCKAVERSVGRGHQRPQEKNTSQVVCGSVTAGDTHTITSNTEI